MIIIVTGLGRCGSSLVMQLLAASGVEVTGVKPFYEADAVRLSAFDPDWLSQQDGKAVKILAVQNVDMPKGDYKVIYCYRDHKEQAKSQKKFYESILPGHKTSTAMLASRIKKESKLCLQAAKRLGPTLSVKFEDFHNEQGLMKNIANLCRFLSLDPEKAAVPMYNTVIKRPKECMPDMQVENMNRD